MIKLNYLLLFKKLEHFTNISAFKYIKNVFKLYLSIRFSLTTHEVDFNL